MAITRKSKKFFLEVEVNVDPTITPPDVPVGTTVFFNGVKYEMTSGGIKNPADIGSGGSGGEGPGPYYYTMPTALPDGVGNAGKLLKAAAGQAVISERTPAIPPAPAVWEITILDQGVAGTPSVAATQYFLFQDKGNGLYSFEPGDRLNVELPMFGQISVDLDPLDGALTFSEFLDAVITEFENQIGGVGQDQLVFIKHTDSLEMRAGAAYPGTQGNQLNARCEVGSQDPSTDVVLSNPPGGSEGSFTGGVDGSGNSGFHMQDDQLAISKTIEAGVHWTPQGGDLNLEAQAIAAAIEAEWVNPGDPLQYYSTVVNGNVITMTRPINGNVGGATGGGVWIWLNGPWGIAPTGIDSPSEPGSDGDVIQADGPWIGKLVEVAGGIATIEHNNVMTFKNDGLVPDGSKVTSSDGGLIKVREQGVDEQLGVALVGGPDQGSSTVLLLYKLQYDE